MCGMRSDNEDMACKFVREFEIETTSPIYSAWVAAASLSEDEIWRAAQVSKDLNCQSGQGGLLGPSILLPRRRKLTYNSCQASAATP